MKISKLVVCMVLPLVCVGLLQAQSLTELAKKEKERRANLKGKKSIVITNQDLKKMDFKPGLTYRLPLEQENSAAGAQTDSPPPKAKTSPSSTAEPQPESSDREGPSAAVIELEELWKRAHDTVGFLNLKLGGLWQQYYSGAAVSLDLLQAQIGLTYLELQEAQKKAEKLRLELEAAKKDKSP